MPPSAQLQVHLFQFYGQFECVYQMPYALTVLVQMKFSLENSVPLCTLHKLVPYGCFFFNSVFLFVKVLVVNGMVQRHLQICQLCSMLEES